MAWTRPRPSQSTIAAVPQDCRGAEASKTTAYATSEELIRNAQDLEWRAGLATAEAAALYAMAATR
jgi:hypothetical protein